MSQDEPTSGVDELKALDKSQKAIAESKFELEEQKTADQLSTKTPKAASQMHVKISSPFKNYFDGQAFSISAENLTGPFDILPQHHNFITLLNACDLIVRQVTAKSDESTVRVKISGGIMHVKSDEIMVFLDV
jgi:hypothetical protein